ncbi:hypothetical protein OIO90_002550 [Microbotryomycetes sp. JL221]|nr:hypothetical protein OIO90_002550 [Microbotryomycetes sp. JL221]
MTDSTSDLLASLPTYDSSEDDNEGDGQHVHLTAREQRIQAARLAAATYKAKIEPPQWYLDPEAVEASEGPQATIRPEVFAIEHFYLNGQFDLVKRKGIEFLTERHLQPSQEATLGKDGAGASEDVQVLDAVMRAALRIDAIDEQVVQWARLYKTRPTAGTLAYTAAQVFDKAGSKFDVHKNEAIEAALAAIARHATMKSYLNLLAKLLEKRCPSLSHALSTRTYPTPQERQKIQAEVSDLELADTAHATLTKVIDTVSEAHNDEQDELPRDVRSL